MLKYILMCVPFAAMFCLEIYKDNLYAIALLAWASAILFIVGLLGIISLRK